MRYNKESRSDAQKKADKKYNQKTIAFSVGYRNENEISDGLRLKAYLLETGQSANSYIKELVKRDLDNKGIPYPPINED